MARCLREKKHFHYLALCVHQLMEAGMRYMGMGGKLCMCGSGIEFSLCTQYSLTLVLNKQTTFYCKTALPPAFSHIL
jgi:hypothetical protein